MDEGTILVIVVVMVIAAMCGVVCASIAEGKGRDSSGWFFLGFVFGPLAILVIAAVANEGKKVGAPAPAPATTASVADELQKLVRLKEAGILTTQEFDEQKSRLLR